MEQSVTIHCDIEPTSHTDLEGKAIVVRRPYQPYLPSLPPVPRQPPILVHNDGVMGGGLELGIFSALMLCIPQLTFILLLVFNKDNLGVVIVTGVFIPITFIAQICMCAMGCRDMNEHRRERMGIV